MAPTASGAKVRV